MTRIVIVLMFLAGVARAQTPKPPAQTIVKAARLFDGTGDRWRANLAVLVEGDRIKAIGAAADLAKSAPGATVIDLGDVTLLPGLIDAHTHLLVGSDEDYTGMLAKRSIAARAIAATASARAMLMAGFTTVRDVESEGAMYADADLAAAIDRGVVDGPRMFVSTRGLAPTGGYLPKNAAWDIQLRAGAQLVNGIDEIRKAVREQVSFGAKWIKIYADFGQYTTGKPERPFRSRPNFTLEEMTAAVTEAHRLGRKVAAHAVGWDGIDQALRAGVDSIEHGWGLSDDLAQRMAQQGVALVSTATALREILKGDSDAEKKVYLGAQQGAIKRALARGVKLVNGSDLGSLPFAVSPASEIAVLVELGVPAPQALRAATSTAGTLLDPLCGPDQADCERGRLGVIAPKAFADMIAVTGDPTKDIKTLEKLRFVMKGGVVYKQ